MKKILLIEDNDDLLETTSEILELKGYKVATASDGQKGLKLALSNTPHLIICDIMMPNMDGYAVLKALRSHSKTAMIPFIFLTAKAQKIDRMVGAAAGADRYLTKPFTTEKLLKIVGDCL